MSVYRTVQGDTWDIIALRMYPKLGGEKLMDRLLEANSEHRDTVSFAADVLLQIPDVEIPVVSSLPPWKRT